MYGDYMVISPAGWILARGADASTATEMNSEFYQQQQEKLMEKWNELSG